MKKKIMSVTFYTLFGVGALLVVCKLLTANSNTTFSVVSIFHRNDPQIKFETEKHNFGTIKDGESVKYFFKFVNTGKTPLIIYTVTPSCGCTVASWPKKPILPGAVDSIEVNYKTHGALGYTDKMVTVESNADTPKRVVTLEGTVIKIYKRDKV